MQMRVSRFGNDICPQRSLWHHRLFLPWDKVKKKKKKIKRANDDRRIHQWKSECVWKKPSVWRHMTLKFAWKYFLFSITGRVGAFEVLNVPSDSYWVSFVYYDSGAPGNVWSQMEFSVEFNLCVSQGTPGTVSLVAYSTRDVWYRCFTGTSQHLARGPASRRRGEKISGAWAAMWDTVILKSVSISFLSPGCWISNVEMWSFVAAHHLLIHCAETSEILLTQEL